MHSRFARFLMTLVVVGTCVLAVIRGWQIVSYSMAETQPEAVLPWVDVPGLAFTAREYARTIVDDELIDAATARKQSKEVAELLAIRPMSSRYWLSLAAKWRFAGEPIGRALELFELSVLTGPNEGYMITQRGLFGILEWEVLPPDVQRRVIAELAVVRLSDRNAVWAQTTLSKKPEKVRQDVRSRLLVQGISEVNLTRMGL